MARVYSFLDGNVRHDNDLRSNSKLYDSNIKMPYRLRKAPKRNLYWVVGEDGKKHSKEPIPKEKAEAQMRILYAAMKKEGKGEILKNITGKGEMEGGKGNQKKLQKLKEDFLKKWKAEHPDEKGYDYYSYYSPLQSDIQAVSKIIRSSSERLRGLKSGPPDSRMRFKELVVIEAERAIDSLFERAVNRGNKTTQKVDPASRHHHIGSLMRHTFDDNESESESEEEAESESDEEEVVMQNPMRRAVVPPPAEERESVPSALVEQPSDRKMRFAPMRIGRGKHTKAVNKELDELLNILEDAESELQLPYYPSSKIKLSDAAKKELKGSVKTYKATAKTGLKEVSKKYPKPTLLGNITSLMDDLYNSVTGREGSLSREPTSSALREEKKSEVRKTARNELRKKYQSLIAPNPYNAARTKYPDVARLEGGAFDPWDIVNPALDVADTVLPGTSTVINAIKNFLDNGETERRKKRQSEIEELESYMASKRERDRAITQRRTGVKTEAEKRDMQQYWEGKYAEKLGPDWRERIKQDPTLPGAIYGEVNREREEADKQYEDETFKDSAVYQEHKRNTALMDAAREKRATDSDNEMWMRRAKQMGVKTIEEAKALNEKRRLEGDGRKKKGGALLHRDPTTKAYHIKEGNRILFTTMSQREAIAFLNDLIKKEKEPKSSEISSSRQNSMAKLLKKLG
jgi:hypothetical protein